MPSALTIRDLRVRYGAIEALHGVDIELEAGEIVAVLGANGAGKSSLLNAIAGLVKGRSGSIMVDGTEISGWPAERIARAGIGLVPEGRRIFNRLTVRENLRLGGYFLAPREFERRLEEMQEIFPIIAKRRDAYAGHLSGGEQQMVALGRSMISHPRVLLLDEPSAGLSPIATASVYQSIARYAREAQVTILLVEQNVRWALELAERGVVLDLGSIKLAGSRDALRGNDRVAQLYLGME
ncbi:MAG: transporter ATP-binding protein [Rhodospirillales bacterium]|nr:transporter ATP-binding protein [Rhodospirillales bacterium]